MAFERDTSSLPIKYADKHFKLCPFCQSNVPDWKVEVSNISSRMKKYAFLCRQCEGIININASNDDSFKTGDFNKVALDNVGRGQYNYNKRGQVISLNELREMCKDDSPDEVEEIVEPVRGGVSDILGGAVIAPREPEREPVRREPEPVRRREPGRRVETPRVRTKPNRPFGFIGLALAGVAAIGALTLISSMTGQTASVLIQNAFLYSVVAIAGLVLSVIGLKTSRNRIVSRIGLIISIIMLVIFFIDIVVGFSLLAASSSGMY